MSSENISAPSSTAPAAAPVAVPAASVKRKATTAGLPGTSRPVKRRASKACHCCRARKVRCDVVENGSPCTNCRLDDVECVVTESKRRKKSRPEVDGSRMSPDSAAETSDERRQTPIEGFQMPRASPSLANEAAIPQSPSQRPLDSDMSNNHVPHMIYQSQNHRLDQSDRLRRMSMLSNASRPSISHGFGNADIQRMLQSTLAAARPSECLPQFITRLPARIQPDDVEYLEKKGALSIPGPTVRNELLKQFVQYVFPYMPIVDLHDVLQTIEHNDPKKPTMSLLLFQAIMFAGSAFADMSHLRAAGFKNRRTARKTFFTRARLLYDFDYELDRLTLVQSLLLMTYWYETPDDQKDTWHWMGVSLSLAHTIGLHRNPSKSGMDAKRQSLWKRIWWSTFMRDRLIALGMRRPTRIKNEDCDVPMLTLDDFDLAPMSLEVTRMLGDCQLTQDIQLRRQLSLLCIEKAKLCLCVSHVLVAQYSVLSHKFGGTTETTMMLVPKKSAAQTSDVMNCNRELEQWLQNLPEDIKYRPTPAHSNQDKSVLVLHRSLLQMIYLTTSSALHRPQVLPSQAYPTVEAGLQDISKRKVRDAATQITAIAEELHSKDLSRFLPTTGVTVLLPAVIIHLLDVKSTDPAVRSSSLRRFYQCMQILRRLRETYASADFATSFLEAAIRKANIQLPSAQVSSRAAPKGKQAMRSPAAPVVPQQQQTKPSAASPLSSSPQDIAPLSNLGSRLHALTPPPDSSQHIHAFTVPISNYSLSNCSDDNNSPDLLAFTASPNNVMSAPSTTINTDFLLNMNGPADAATPPLTESSANSANGSTNDPTLLLADASATAPFHDFEYSDLEHEESNGQDGENSGQNNRHAAISDDSLNDLMNLAGDADVTKMDFDALIDFDAGADLFAAEEGIFSRNSNYEDILGGNGSSREDESPMFEDGDADLSMDMGDAGQEVKMTAKFGSGNPNLDTDWGMDWLNNESGNTMQDSGLA